MGTLVEIGKFLASENGVALALVVVGAIHSVKQAIDLAWKKRDSRANLLGQIASRLYAAAEELGRVQKWTGAEKLSWCRAKLPDALRAAGVRDSRAARAILDALFAYYAAAGKVKAK